MSYMSVDDYKRFLARKKNENSEQFIKRMYKVICSSNGTENEKEAARALLRDVNMSLVFVD